MGLWVQKFGGTSVANAERIRAVAKRVAAAKRSGLDLVVVVSAMGDTTDDLIALAGQVSAQPIHREMDMLLSTGERVSMALLSMALADLGVEAQSFTGSQSGIITDGSHRRARIKRILGDRIRVSLSRGRVPIVAGFQGVSEDKEITTLGRGGSDTTAVALAIALGAEGCDIYTDVDGVYPVDPRVAQSKKAHLPWPRVPADLMVEWASLGAGVLHFRCVELARKYGVKLRVLNSLNEDNGMNTIQERHTSIVSQDGLERMRVAGITADTNKVFVSVQLARPTVITALWDKIQTLGVVAVAPTMTEKTVGFFVDAESSQDLDIALKSLSRDGFVSTFTVDPEQVPVSVVGDCFSTEAAGIGQSLQCLMDAGISVHRWVASSLSVTLSVPRAKAVDAVRALEHRWLEGSV